MVRFSRNDPTFLSFLTGLAILSSRTFLIAAENSIRVDSTSVGKDALTRNDDDDDDAKGFIGSATVSFENADLFSVPSLTVSGIGEEPFAIYTKIKSVLTTRNNGSKQVTWSGAMQDAAGFATIVKFDDGHVTGSFTTAKAACSLITLRINSAIVRCVKWEDLPDELDYDSSSSSSSSNQRSVIRDWNPTASSSVKLDNSGNTIESFGKAADIVSAGSRRLPEAHASRDWEVHRKLQSSAVTDVLVLVTHRAMCKFAGLPVTCENNVSNRGPTQERMAVLKSQTDSAMQEVGVDAEIRIIEMIIINDAEPEPLPVNDMALETLVSNKKVNEWRDNIGADLVAVITDGLSGEDQGCGIADIDGWISITDWGCLDGFTFSHELGHNYGCRHNRENSGESLHPYAHGFRISGVYRTIMSYECPGSSCPRFPYFSNDAFSIDINGNGWPMGSSTEDNARLLAQTVQTVSNNKPPTEDDFCPASALCPPGTNLMRKRFMFIFGCRQECVSFRFPLFRPFGDVAAVP
jgi:hypothetical protein